MVLHHYSLWMKKTQQDQTFQTDVGQKAIVEHHAIENDEYTTALREVLSDMGRDLQLTGKVPKELEYVGSFSVHVYQGSLRNFAFAGVMNPGGCHRMLADAALSKLREDVEEYYAGTRRKKRSGF